MTFGFLRRSLVTIRRPTKPLDAAVILGQKDPIKVKQEYLDRVDRKKVQKQDKVNSLIHWNPDQPHRLHTIFDDMENMVPLNGGPHKTGRSWDVFLLRYRTFEELRQIWFANLWERNRLLTRGHYSESLPNKNSAEYWHLSWKEDGGINKPMSDSSSTVGTGLDEGAIYGVGKLGALGGEQGVRMRKVQTTLDNIRFVIQERQGRYLKALKLHYMIHHEGYSVQVPVQYIGEDSIGENYVNTPNEQSNDGWKYKLEDFDPVSRQNIENYEVSCKDQELLFDLIMHGRFLPQRGLEIVRKMTTPEAIYEGKRIVYRKHWRYGQTAKVKLHYAHFNVKQGKVTGGRSKDVDVLDMRPLHDRRKRSRRRISKFRLKRGQV